MLSEAQGRVQVRAAVCLAVSVSDWELGRFHFVDWLCFVAGNLIQKTMCDRWLYSR